MTKLSPGIRYLAGTSDLLVVAPHGPKIDGQFKNDIRTGIIAEQLHRLTGCTALINDRFFKPAGDLTKSLPAFLLDLYRIDHSARVPGYLETIGQVVAVGPKTLVLWVHGIAEPVAMRQGQEHLEQGLFAGPADALDALIAFGQGPDPKSGQTADSLTARLETVQRFADALTTAGMRAIATRREAGNFRGRDAKRLNQWFGQQGYGLDRVESLQLEIREAGFRDSDANALKAAGIIATALSGLMERK